MLSVNVKVFLEHCFYQMAWSKFMIALLKTVGDSQENFVYLNQLGFLVGIVCTEVHFMDVQDFRDH